MPAGEDGPLWKCVSRDSASLKGREGWAEGIEHRGEACLGSCPTGTPIDDVEWKRRLFNFTHKVIILASNCLSSLEFRPNASQLHINLSIFSFVCSNICFAKPPVLYKCLAGTDKCHSCAVCFIIDLLDVFRGANAKQRPSNELN